MGLQPALSALSNFLVTASIWFLALQKYMYTWSLLLKFYTYIISALLLIKQAALNHSIIITVSVISQVLASFTFFVTLADRQLPLLLSQQSLHSKTFKSLGEKPYAMYHLSKKGKCGTTWGSNYTWYWWQLWVSYKISQMKI